MRDLLQVLMKRTVLLAKTCSLELRLCYITHRQSQVIQPAVTSICIHLHIHLRTHYTECY